MPTFQDEILVAVGFELVWLAGGQYTPKTNMDTQNDGLDVISRSFSFLWT